MLKLSVTKKKLVLSDMGGKAHLVYGEKVICAYQCNGITIKFPLHFY